MNYKVRARTQNFVAEKLKGCGQLPQLSKAEEAERGYGHLRGVLQGGAWCAHALPGSLFALVTSMEKDFGPYLVPPEGLSPLLGRSLARQSSVSWESIWAPRTVRSLGICQLSGSSASKVSGCTTRTKCLGRRVLRSFCCDVWASSVQRTVSRETAELHAAAEVSWRSRATFGGTAHQKGFPWGFREVGVALIPLTCVTAPGSPRLSSLSV